MTPCCLSLDSYIKPQPQALADSMKQGCLSLDSYIKPQHNLFVKMIVEVVYLLIPTSNHNRGGAECAVKRLFIS